MKRLLYKTFYLLLFTFLMFFLMQISVKPGFAFINSGNNTDTCSKLNISFSESPSCPDIGGNGKNNMGSYSFIIKISSKDGKKHSINYSSSSDFCTDPYLKGGKCKDNFQQNTVDANTSTTVTISRSPTQGSFCGSYQLDFQLHSVDGNSNCTYQNGGRSQGAAGLCETGNDCTQKLPDCTTGASNCSACAAPNTCSNDNGTRTCTRDQPKTCSPVIYSTSCTINNCSGNNACVSGKCSGSNNTPTPTSKPGSTPTPTTKPKATPTPTSPPVPTLTPTPTIGPCQVPAYTISGKNYTDTNTDGYYQAGTDGLYTGPGATITITGCSATNSIPIAGGSYTTPMLPYGTYTVTYPTVPSGYNMTYPLFGTPPSFSVTLGPACSNSSNYHDMSCSSGNITGLDFGMNNAPPWVQNVCGDTRVDTGFNQQLPPSPTNSCGTPNGSYEIVSNNTCTNVPGIAFSGDTGNPPTMFGSTGKASVANWIVGGSAYPETFNPGNSATIKTSYEYLVTSARKSGITPINLASVCTLANCTLPANLAHGIYQANSSVTLNAYTFPANANYVFLINGSLTMVGNILIPTGTTATFASTGNMIVDKSVGEATTTSCQSNIEGFYITDTSFVVNTVGKGNGPDKRLNILGSVVTNAARNGGKLQDNRDLLIGNANTPAVTFTQRADFIVNAPALIKRQNHIWQEIAP